MVERIMKALEKSFTDDRIKIYLANNNEIYMEVSPENIKKTCCYIYSNFDCSLVTLFACHEMHLNKDINRMSVLYTFSVKNAGALLIIKTFIDSTDSKLESICEEIPAAALYEREIKDLFGIDFTGHPDDRSLVFHENWPDGVYPLNKNFEKSTKPEFVQKTHQFTNIEGKGVFEIPVGPIHAGIIEPGHFRFSVAGEPIINLEAKLYYTHKGIEKLSEEQSIEKVLFISERISGDETFTNSLAYCQAIEKIAGLKSLPERAAYTRTILAELERIYNHLTDIAGICTDVASWFAANQFNMIRRWILILNEQLTGSRFLRSSNRPGGLRKDHIKNNEKNIIENMVKLKIEFNESVNIMKSNGTFIDRVENTGVVSKKVAFDLNAVGPAARATGLAGDVRVDYPYAAYNKIKFAVSAHNNGDVNCRMNVKIDELRESINIILDALDSIPEKGAFIEPITNVEAYKCAFGMTESPRGENIHFVMTGENNSIFRYKIRTPSFCNWPVLCHAVKGNVVPDFPLINKSFNLSYSGNDL